MRKQLRLTSLLIGLPKIAICHSIGFPILVCSLCMGATTLFNLMPQDLAVAFCGSLLYLHCLFSSVLWVGYSMVVFVVVVWGGGGGGGMGLMGDLCVCVCVFCLLVGWVHASAVPADVFAIVCGVKLATLVRHTCKSGIWGIWLVGWFARLFFFCFFLGGGGLFVTKGYDCEHYFVSNMRFSVEC